MPFALWLSPSFKTRPLLSLRFSDNLNYSFPAKSACRVCISIPYPTRAFHLFLYRIGRIQKPFKCSTLNKAFVSVPQYKRAVILVCHISQFVDADSKVGSSFLKVKICFFPSSAIHLDCFAITNVFRNRTDSFDSHSTDRLAMIIKGEILLLRKGGLYRNTISNSN